MKSHSPRTSKVVPVTLHALEHARLVELARVDEAPATAAKRLLLRAMKVRAVEVAKGRPRKIVTDGE